MSGLIINSYGISVEIPMHEPNPCETVKATKKLFASRQEKEINALWRKNFERATALIEYAESCGGKLKKVASRQSFANFTFEFGELENLQNFAKNLKYIIESSVN